MSDDAGIFAGASGGILAFAPADDAGIGLDPHDRGVESPDLAEVALVLALLLDRDSHPGRFDMRNAHDVSAGCCPVCSGYLISGRIVSADFSTSME